jgi:hypothetical protein
MAFNLLLHERSALLNYLWHLYELDEDERETFLDRVESWFNKRERKPQEVLQ